MQSLLETLKWTTAEFYAVIVMNVLFRSRIDNHINLRI